jgi:putative ABC transport system permease protein
MSAAVRPPRVARTIAAACVPGSLREYVLGDLDEQFAAAAIHGRWSARRRYWRQTWGLLRHAVGLHRRGRQRTDAQPVIRGGDMSRIARDVQFGLRSIVRSPGYSAIAVVTVALAIGANTLLFSIANPLVVRPLPIQQPETLGWIMLSSAEREIERGRASLPEFLEWRAAMSSFGEMAAMDYSGGTLTGHGDARRVRTARVTADLHSVWGLRPIAGRLFQPGEDRPGHPLVAVLSARFWREAFLADPSVVGRTFGFDGAAIAIVGVMDPGIEFGDLALVDLWMPLPLDATGPRDRRTLSVVGTLAPGATVASADAELQTVFANQSRAYPAANRGWRANVRTTTAAISGNQTWLILGLLGVVVVFVLLIACANLANLVLARLLARRQESALRLALGASRWQLIRPLLIESLILSVAGGVLGLALAQAGLRIINAIATEPFMRQIRVDGNVVAFTAVLSILTPVLFALWPALTTGRGGSGALLHGSRTSGTRETGRRRRVLIAAQVALALALLTVSALVTQSLAYLQRIDPGFEYRPLLTYRFDLPAARYGDDPSRLAFVRTLEARLAALPGVNGAAVVSHLPVIEADFARVLRGTLHDGTSDADRPWASSFGVTPGYFQATGLPALAGRVIEPRDRFEAEPVAVLNRMAAERYFDSIDNAIGRRVLIHDTVLGERPATIIGVVADTRDAQLTRSSPQMYLPLDQWPRSSFRAIIRSATPLDAARPTLDAMRALDPEVAVADLKPVAQVMEEELSSSRIINGLLVAYSIVALALAAGGLFGVISYSVGQRRREIGVRLALGASPSAVGRMVVREGLAIAGIGAAIGLVLGLVLAELSAALLFGIGPRDPATFAGVVAVILIVALLASWLPAARAMRVDPARTLRAD